MAPGTLGGEAFPPRSMATRRPRTTRASRDGKSSKVSPAVKPEKLEKPQKEAAKAAPKPTRAIAKTTKPEKIVSPVFTTDAVPADTAEEKGETVLYVEADEEIPSIIERVRAAKHVHIALVVPKRALFVESLVNVKLLQREADVAGKSITLVSTDRKALHLATQVGLPTRTDLPEGAPVPRVREEVRTPAHDATAAPITKAKRLSLQELLAARRAKPASQMVSLDPKEPLPQVAFTTGSPNRRLFLFFLGLCLVALIVVAYFVLPKATIAIELASNVENVTARIVLADGGTNDAELKVKDTIMVRTTPVSAEKEMTKTYASTGIVSSGTNAQGIMTIVNDSGSTQPLIQATRFRSPDGIIYRLQAAVTVPARGTTTALVAADPVDEAGKLVGDRGNIAAGTKFTLPALTGTNRSLVYGTNAQAFAGGVTKTARIVTQADLDAARKDLTQIARDSAVKELEERQRTSGAPLLVSDALMDDQVVSFTILDGVAAKSTVENFRATVKVRITGRTFDRDGTTAILTREVSKRIHPDQRLATQDVAGLRIDIVEPRDAREERLGRVKANATMKVRYEYTLSDELVATVKKRILGDGMSEAQRYVSGLEQVAQSRITTWPFWVRRIPGISSAVEVVVVPAIQTD